MPRASAATSSRNTSPISADRAPKRHKAGKAKGRSRRLRPFLSDHANGDYRLGAVVVVVVLVVVFFTRCRT
jgi:hypothetical protein